MTIPELSLETQQLIDRFLKLAVDELVTYGELTELIGRNVRGSARGLCRTAIHRIQRDYGILIECEAKVGFKRIEGAKAVAAGGVYVPRIHRASRRAIRKLSCVGDMSKLSEAERTKFNATASHLGALQLATTEKVAKKIEAAVSKVNEKLAIEQTLALFGK